MMKRVYRIYKVDTVGRLLDPPMVYSAESDEVALGFALQLRSDYEGISVWQAGRHVQETRPALQSKESTDAVPAGESRELRASACHSEVIEVPGD